MKKDEFLAELRANLKKKHVPKISIDDALAYYDEAIRDRMEDGMSEEKAGSISTGEYACVSTYNSAYPL